MTTHRIIVSVGLAIALGLLSGAAVSRTESAARSEPPKLVLEGKRALDIRVCEVEDDGGIMVMDQPDHFIISGGTLSNMIANGFGVTPDRVRGISDERDIHIGIELAGELPGENRVKLMADAAAAFAGCRAALKKEPGDVYTISFGKTKPLPSAGKGETTAGERLVKASGVTLEGFASSLDGASGLYFVAHTPAKERGVYDFKVLLPPGVNWTDDAAITAIQDQTGLVVTKSKGEVPYVSVTWQP